MDNYLSNVPENLAYIGDHSQREIEIIEQKLDQAGFGIVYEDQFIRIVRDPVIFPNKSEGGYIRIFPQASVKTAGSVIIPVIQHNVVFIRLFRHATRAWELELPRGFQEANLSPEQNARQETLEEIGVNASSVEHIGLINANTGLLALDMDVFVAELTEVPPKEAPVEDGEVYARELVPYAELDQFLIAHSVRCSISLSALYLAKIKGYF